MAPHEIFPRSTGRAVTTARRALYSNATVPDDSRIGLRKRHVLDYWLLAPSRRFRRWAFDTGQAGVARTPFDPLAESLTVKAVGSTGKPGREKKGIAGVE